MPDNSNRNTIIFVVLAFLMLMAYQVFVMEPQAKRREAELKARGGDQAQQVPGAKAVAQKAVYLPRAQAATKSPRVAIDTPSVYGSISLRGARVDDLYLKGYRTKVDPKSPAVELLRPEGAQNAWFAEFGWAGANLPGLPTPDTVWTLVQGSRLAPGQPVTLRYDSGKGLVFTRKISVDDKFMFTVADTVTNATAGALTLAPYASVQRQGLPAGVDGATAHEGAVGVLDKTLRLVKYKAWKKDGEKNFSSDGGWLGITDKYWLAAVIPDQAENVHTAFRVTQASGVDIYESNFVAQPRTVGAGKSFTHTSRLFAGAKTVPVLKGYQDELKIPRFVDAVDWGTLYFFTKPIFWLLEQFNALLHNFGLSILALTVVVKLAFFYPANLSFESMTKMKKIQPETEALRVKFKDDPARQQQEMMALYQREKINPLLGCLPMLATIPVFLALFKVLNVAIEMRHAPFYGWIQDLSAPDPTSFFTLFGLLPWDPSIVPFLGPLMAHLGVWPLAYGVTTWLSMAMSPPAPDPVQQRMMQAMPIIFTFVLAPMAVGLLIYYSWSNILTILQQYVIMRRYKVENPIDRIIGRVTGKTAASG